MENPAPGILIELDDRRRASFGRIGHHHRYLARTERDGTIILTPAVVMPVAELERLVPGAELALLVGPEKARQINETYHDNPAALHRRTRQRSLRQEILSVVRAAGTEGIAAKEILASVDAARSRVFNELANLRNTKEVQNLTGRYTLGPAAQRS